MQSPGYEQEGVKPSNYGLPESMRLFVDKLKKDIMDLGSELASIINPIDC